MTATRILLHASALDTLLLEDDAAGRTEAVLLLQAQEDTAQENARWAARDAADWDLLQQWAAEREAEEAAAL